MRFYHYTTDAGARGIFKDQVIRRSSPNPLNGNTVSLTTDQTSVGHGLLDGREVTEELALALDGRAETAGESFICHDHTAWRVVLELMVGNPHLVKAEGFHSTDELLGLDIAGHHPEYSKLPDDLLLQTYGKFRVGTLQHKSPTWWYFRADLPLPDGAWFERRADCGEFERACPGSP